VCGQRRRQNYLYGRTFSADTHPTVAQHATITITASRSDCDDGAYLCSHHDRHNHCVHHRSFSQCGVVQRYVGVLFSARCQPRAAACSSSLATKNRAHHVHEAIELMRYPGTLAKRRLPVTMHNAHSTAGRPSLGHEHFIRGSSHWSCRALEIKSFPLMLLNISSLVGRTQWTGSRCSSSCGILTCAHGSPRAIQCILPSSIRPALAPRSSLLPGRDHN